MAAPKRIRTLIMGAAGRDFHNFNMVFRDDPRHEVVAFTATQIPNIAGRRYPAALAGKRYPRGIPIYPESELPNLIRRLKVDEVVFAYSDISHLEVMHKASLVLACGANFRLLDGASTSLKAKVPVISICAVRTGSGKSQTTRKVAAILRAKGRRVVVVRHPMPYGNLAKQAVQRFATYEDLDRQKCTIEEREEYEPHIDRGSVVYAGVDYARILRAAEREADVVLWDGGNNDTPFFQSDFHIVLADPHRPGHEEAYHPGETNVRRADLVIINKADTALPGNVALVREHVQRLNPKATILLAHSPYTTEQPELVHGKRVLAIEDGPTVTHGEMPFGAATLAARRLGAAELLDPRPYAVGSIRGVYEKYPHIGPLLPAMGYGKEQIDELRETIERTPCDLVLSGTPIDLRRVLTANKPILRVRYELDEQGPPFLADVLKRF